MKVLNTLLWTAIGVAMLNAWGCDVSVGGHERRERVIVEERPVYVQPVQREVVVERAPPPSIEVRVR